MISMVTPLLYSEQQLVKKVMAGGSSISVPIVASLMLILKPVNVSGKAERGM